MTKNNKKPNFDLGQDIYIYFFKCICLCGDGATKVDCLINICHWFYFCKTDINECNSGPCVNGECDDMVNGYQCTCTAGYTGINCDMGWHYLFVYFFIIL